MVAKQRVKALEGKVGKGKAKYTLLWPDFDDPDKCKEYLPDGTTREFRISELPSDEQDKIIKLDWGDDLDLDKGQT